MQLSGRVPVHALRRALPCSLALLAFPALLDAQLIRGRITERATSAPLSGVVVEVFGAQSQQRVAAGLSGPDGAYAVRLPSAGSYVVTAKRIGVRRVQTDTLSIADGETVVRDLVIDAVLYTLPEVVVTGITSCFERTRELSRVSALWEEARTALTASEISLRDELFRAHVTRYVRELEGRDLRVLSETRSEVAGVVSRPFTSVDPDSLSTQGYWWTEPDGSVVYYGPDAEVLLSDAFVRDHCFAETRSRDRRGMVGLAFRPHATRVKPDIIGTVWLDERTFELRFVEFTYTRTLVSRPETLGGQVHFARLPSGAWIVRRWYIRLPMGARPTAPLITRQTTAPWMLVRPTSFPLREEGGEVAAEELVRASRLVTVSGTIRDSANRPWEGARIRVAGTRLAAISRATGAFTIDSVPVGNHTVLVEDPAYDSLGLSAAETRFEVTLGRAPQVSLRAFNGRALFGRVCPERTPRPGTGALRITVRSSAGDSLLMRLPMQVSWTVPGRGSRPGTPVFLERATDGQGRVTLCEVPASQPVTVIIARLSGGASDPVVVTVPDRGARGIILNAAGSP